MSSITRTLFILTIGILLTGLISINMSNNTLKVKITQIQKSSKSLPVARN